MWQAHLAEAAAFSGDRNFAVSHPTQSEMAAYQDKPEVGSSLINICPVPLPLTQHVSVESSQPFHGAYAPFYLELGHAVQDQVLVAVFDDFAFPQMMLPSGETWNQAAPTEWVL